MMSIRKLRMDDKGREVSHLNLLAGKLIT
jgi:hypothetical protein